MKNRKTQSALVVAGAAVGAAAALFGKRRYGARVAASGAETTNVTARGNAPPGVAQPGAAPPHVPRESEQRPSERKSEREPAQRNPDFVGLVSEDLVEADGPELPIGRSADPAIDDALQHDRPGRDETSGAALLTEPERSPPLSEGTSLDEVWDATPGFVEEEQSEGYDAVTPEDLGSVWLSRATQTTHEARPHASDPLDVPDVEDLAAQELPDVDDEDDEDDEDDDGDRNRV